MYFVPSACTCIMYAQYHLHYPCIHIHTHTYPTSLPIYTHIHTHTHIPHLPPHLSPHTHQPPPTPTPLRYHVLPLHSQVSPQDQRLVFRPVPPGCRKIILATNIAETAITIDDVVCVVNSGRMKEKSYDPFTGVSTLQVGCWGIVVCVCVCV